MSPHNRMRLRKKPTLSKRRFISRIRLAAPASFRLQLRGLRRSGKSCRLRWLNYMRSKNKYSLSLGQQTQQRKEEPSGAIRSADIHALSRLKTVSNNENCLNPLSGSQCAQRITHLESGVSLEPIR
ncbi:hypothetical protein Fmac_028115 [Flemingia macrophylla]|uniref:Ribosomal protein L20 n=1 Tax=Flemingia macrophylla TaxID=520843 RepID=A0ABD1LJU9_9FABA